MKIKIKSKNLVVLSAAYDYPFRYWIALYPNTGSIYRWWDTDISCQLEDTSIETLHFELNSRTKLFYFFPCSLFSVHFIVISVSLTEFAYFF